jgi:hypothetical protein
MWDRLTREQKLDIIGTKLNEVENQLKELYDLREILEAEQLKLRLN